MKKLISTLAASCLVALAITPANAQLPGTGSVSSSRNSSIFSTGSVSSSRNSSILPTGSVSSSGNSSILSTGSISSSGNSSILSTGSVSSSGNSSILSTGSISSSGNSSILSTGSVSSSRNSSIFSTGSIPSSGNSSILSTGSVSSSGNSSILSTGSVSSSRNSSIFSTAATSTSYIANILESKTKSTAGASVSKDITSKVQETTSHSIGTLLGSTTDSQTTAFANPIQALSNPRTPTILATGEATAEVKIGPNSVDVFANASSGVQVGDLIKLNTCSNAHVTVGSSDASRFASCSHQVKARKVPEPSTIFGLTLLGAFLIFSRRKSFSVKKAEIIRPLKIG